MRSRRYIKHNARSRRVLHKHRATRTRRSARKKTSRTKGKRRRRRKTLRGGGRAEEEAYWQMKKDEREAAAARREAKEQLKKDEREAAAARREAKEQLRRARPPSRQATWALRSNYAREWARRLALPEARDDDGSAIPSKVERDQLGGGRCSKD